MLGANHLPAWKWASITLTGITWQAVICLQVRLDPWEKCCCKKLYEIPLYITYEILKSKIHTNILGSKQSCQSMTFSFWRSQRFCLLLESMLLCIDSFCSVIKRERENTIILPFLKYIESLRVPITQLEQKKQELFELDECTKPADNRVIVAGKWERSQSAVLHGRS